ncbi:hypothetical protein LX36DRAFT_427113 [Colletotrichum falcatum]|nr:hypothetical protein LX36DRAFT_427113 [Colletotrichum falcatum]
MFCKQALSTRRASGPPAGEEVVIRAYGSRIWTALEAGAGAVSLCLPRMRQSQTLPGLWGMLGSSCRSRATEGPTQLKRITRVVLERLGRAVVLQEINERGWVREAGGGAGGEMERWRRFATRRMPQRDVDQVPSMPLPLSPFWRAAQGHPEPRSL